MQNQYVLMWSVRKLWTLDSWNPGSFFFPSFITMSFPLHLYYQILGINYGVPTSFLFSLECFNSRLNRCGMFGLVLRNCVLLNDKTTTPQGEEASFHRRTSL